MNVVSRGVKNALRSPVRSGAIVLMLAISVALILSMLVARSSVESKIAAVKATSGTGITISPAGVQGFSGGGNALTAAQLTEIKSVAHITNVTSTLSDQLGSTDTNLTSSLTLGTFGARQQRFDSTGGGATGAPETASTSTGTTSSATRVAMTPHITVVGTSNASNVSIDGTAVSLKIQSGSTIDGSSSNLVALVGSSLATKNSLKAGSTFTAYGKTITVSGIYTTGNTFEDSGIIMPLSTIQTLSDQAGAVSSVSADADNSDNTASVVAALKSKLGSAVDITDEATEAASSVSSLQSISSLALTGVIGAAIAGAVIILLAMVMVVRERRREIGVIKAIGGTNGKVIVQFMSEALTLTLIGAIVGLVIGILVSGPLTSGLVKSNTSTTSTATTDARGQGGGFGRSFRGGVSQLNTNINSVKASLTPEVFLSAIGITLLIAIIGSAVPAYFIAKVRPAEVLRTE